MAPNTQPADVDEQRRLPKSLRLLRSSMALADECAREIVASFDAPDLAATGDRIERVEDEKRALAAAMEDHLRGALLSPFDPADLHGLSASIALLTHRTARALYVFSLLGAAPAPGELRILSRLLADVSAELVVMIDLLAAPSSRTIGPRVRGLRQLRDQAHLQAGKILAPSSADQELLLWRTIGQAIDAAVTQALGVAEECLRIATKHD